MTTCCKGVCERFKAKTPANKARYAAGQKFCSVCKVFFLLLANRCPCCKTKLRTKTRTSPNKRAIRYE